VVVEIDPMRVGAFDQVEFPLAFPFLDLLFPANRTFDRIVQLEPDQLVNAIARCETRDGLALVLEHPLHEIGGHANIQRPVRLAREQIDVKHGQPSLAAPRSRNPGSEPPQRFTVSTVARTIEIELPAAGWIPAS